MHFNSRYFMASEHDIGWIRLLAITLLPVFRCEAVCRAVAKSLIAIASSFLILSTTPPARAQQATVALFQNVWIFEGKSDVVAVASNVLIQDIKIGKI
jgi:hypothetical protein